MRLSCTLLLPSAILVLLLGCCTCAWALESAQDPRAADVLKCLNAQDCRAARTTWSHMLKDQPSCIQAHQVCAIYGRLTTRSADLACRLSGLVARGQ